MRVLHVIRRLDLTRGAERIVAELARNLPDHDVLCFEGGRNAYDLGEAKVWRAAGPLHALLLLLRLKAHYDIFHLHLPPSIYFAALLGKRAVVHEHSVQMARKTGLISRLLSKLSLRRAKSVIAVSEAARKSVNDRVGRRSRVYAVPNFVPNLPRSDRTESEQPKLLMVAAFSRPKRQDIAIRALAFLPEDFELCFAGLGPDLFRCQELAQQLGVAHRVNFLGAVRNIEDVYAEAHLCLLISEWEGFGLVAMEAAQSGKATIVSDIEGLRENCVDSRLLFKGSDPEVLAARIEVALAFCREDEFRRKLAEAASRFSIERYAERLAEIYA